MRKAPTILAGIFLAITLTRVAEYSAGFEPLGILGWLFAAGLGFSVFMSAYHNRVTIIRNEKEEKRSIQARQMAFICLVFFCLIDGVFNLADVLGKNKVFDESLRSNFLELSTILYGAFPTIAAILLGLLQSRVDRLPKPPNTHSVFYALRKKFISLLNLPEPKKKTRKSKAQPVVNQIPETTTSWEPDLFVPAKKSLYRVNPSANGRVDKLTPRQAEIWGLIKNNLDKSGPELARITGLNSRQAVGSYLNKFRDIGLIERV